jgi:hypothetical protein
VLAVFRALFEAITPQSVDLALFGDLKSSLHIPNEVPSWSTNFLQAP